MKSRFQLLILSCIVGLGSGCDKPFSPKEDFQERYVLQCFVQGDYEKNLESVTALLARTYDVEGFNPSANTNDPAIAGAEVTLTFDGKPYNLQEAFRPAPEGFQYGTRQRYYSRLVTAPPPESKVGIIAKLPNGQTLSAQTIIPRGRAFTSSYEFAAGLTTRLNLQPGKPNWIVGWENYDDTEVHLFYPRLTILYTKMEGGVERTGSVPVPVRYVSGGGGPIPVYPSYSTNKSCSFEFYAIDSAMAQISAGDPDKHSHGLHTARLEVIEYDLPLSKYFSSVNGSLDQFSIRTDQLVFSNVGGGIGILASFIVHKVQFDFDIRYVLLYGYRYR
jgi:hypothetical protein